MREPCLERALSREARRGASPRTGARRFERAHRAARKGRNPRTGEPAQITASTTVKFKPGQGLKDAVNGGG